MLDTLILRPLRGRKPRRWSLREALDSVSSAEARGDMPAPAAAPEPPALPPVEDEQFPAIVVKAQEDLRCRDALARLGYFRVRAHYLGHRLRRRPTFDSLEGEYLWPTMEFVQDWLTQERKQVVARTRFPFLMAMLATILAGLAFLSVAAVLG
jgi:hypothetical protein